MVFQSPPVSFFEKIIRLDASKQTRLRSPGDTTRAWECVSNKAIPPRLTQAKALGTWTKYSQIQRGGKKMFNECSFLGQLSPE